MELSVHNVSPGNYPYANETRADQWQEAARARELRGQIRANEPGNSQGVYEAYKVERLNDAADARELRPITYDNTHLNKIRSFLTVAQNGKQVSFVDLYV